LVQRNQGVRFDTGGAIRNRCFQTGPQGAVSVSLCAPPPCIEHEQRSMVDTIDTIEANSLVFKDMRKSQTTGGVSVPVCKSSGERLTFQTSFGLHDKLMTNFTVNTPQSGDPTRCNLVLKLEEVNETLKAFLSRIDECVLKESATHQEWFSTFAIKGDFCEGVKDIYQPLVKRNATYGDSMRVKIVLPSDKNKYPTQIFVVVDEDVEDGQTVLRYRKGEYVDLVKGTQCIATVDTQGVWFAKALNTFGISLTATTVLVWDVQESKGGRGGIGSFNLGGTVLVLKEEDVQDDMCRE